MEGTASASLIKKKRKHKRQSLIPYQLAFYLILLTGSYYFFKHPDSPHDGRQLYAFGPSCNDVDYDSVLATCETLRTDSSSCSDTRSYYSCLRDNAFACYKNYVEHCEEDLLNICDLTTLKSCDCPTPQLYFDDAFFEQPYCKNKGSPTSGAVILHIIGILYMFLGLSVVCDEYFCGALDVMVEHYQVKPDVAGATFMAAGGSAPELFTSLMGVFFSESDVGFGTIVGSAVFNVLFVIGLCAAFAKSTLQLTWWPLFRDCSYYLVSLSVLTGFATDRVIHWYEAVILFLMYCTYVTMMRWNTKLENFFTALLFHHQAQQVSPVMEVENDNESNCSHAQERNDSVPQLPTIPTSPSAKHMQQVVKRSVTRDLRRGSMSVDSARGVVEKKRSGGIKEGMSKIKATANLLIHHRRNSSHEQQPQTSKKNEAGEDEDSRRKSAVIPLETDENKKTQGKKKAVAADEAAGMAVDVEKGRSSTSVVGVESFETSPREDSQNQKQKLLQDSDMKQAKEKSGEQEAVADGDDDDEHNPFEWPEGRKEQFVFIATLPVVAVLHFAIPNCSNPKYEKYFLATFSISLLWIALFSFLLVWWATIFGAIIGIEDIVMGLTFLAAGTSIPDAVSSVVMARIGEGDMAVSSSIGSNIFDILFGLPIPWFISTAIVTPLKENKVGTIEINSGFITIYVLLLIFMVFLVIVSIMYRKWKLDKGLGAIMAGLYAVFLAIAISIEQTQPEALKF